MVDLLERASDRLLNIFAPKVEAQADPCNSCSPKYGYSWGENCGCSRTTQFKKRYYCNTCGWEYVGCKPFCTSCCIS